jgi:cytochrome c
MQRHTIARLAVAGLAWTAAAMAQADPEALAAQAKCIACHHATDKRVGPSWAAVRERYAGEADAVGTLRARVRAGGSGVWGKIPMPPVPAGQLGDDDLDAVLRWVLEG